MDIETRRTYKIRTRYDFLDGRIVDDATGQQARFWCGGDSAIKVFFATGNAKDSQSADVTHWANVALFIKELVNGEAPTADKPAIFAASATPVACTWQEWQDGGDGHVVFTADDIPFSLNSGNYWAAFWATTDAGKSFCINAGIVTFVQDGVGFEQTVNPPPEGQISWDMIQGAPPIPSQAAITASIATQSVAAAAAAAPAAAATAATAQLPGIITAQLPGVVDGKIGGAVAPLLPAQLDAKLPPLVTAAVQTEVHDALGNLNLQPGDPLDYTVSALSLGQGWNTIGGMITATLAEASVSLAFLPIGTIFEAVGKVGRYAYQGSVNGQSTFTAVKNVTAENPPAVGDTLRVVAVAGAAGTDGSSAGGTLRYDVSQSLESDERAQAFANLGLIIDSSRIAIGNAAGVSSTSTAIGNNSSATGYRATALGHSAQATGDDTFAGGYQAYAGGGNATALGSGAHAAGGGATAIGVGSNANSENTTALGYNATAYDYNAVAIGYAAYAYDCSLSAGCQSLANSRAVALGYYAETRQGGVAVGYGSYAYDYAVAIGNQAQSLSGSAVAIGYNAYAYGYGSIAFGGDSYSGSDGATAIGCSSGGNGYASTAIGYAAYAQYQSTALGANASVYSDNSVALGYNAYVNSQYSVAIGCESQAYGSYIVSVGSEYIRRRITNVAYGSYENDAATVGQVQALVIAFNSATGQNFALPTAA